jgi:RND family efflux transporter MFP subunit
LLATAVVTVVGCMDKHPEPVDTPPPVVEVARPLERDVIDYQVFTARTQAVESVDVKARVTGYLKKIRFKDGEDVKKDKVLFEIDDRTYKASLDKAKADLETANASLVKNEAFYKIGLDVRKDNPAAMSEQEIERRKGGRDEAKGTVKQAEAALESAELYYKWCTVKAPIDGRITRHFVDEGNLISQDVTVLAQIVSLKPVWAYLDVDQNTAIAGQALVKAGKIQPFRLGKTPVGMRVGVGDEQSFPIAGIIDYVSPSLDPNTGTIQVRARFENADEKLVAGLFARVRVPMTDKHPALLVNDLAIGTDQGKKFLLIVNDKNEVVYRAVEVGQLHQGLREVRRSRTVTDIDTAGKVVTKQVPALDPTDQVIVNGLQRVRTGATVKPKLVDMETLRPK